MDKLLKALRALSLQQLNDLNDNLRNGSNTPLPPKLFYFYKQLTAFFKKIYAEHEESIRAENPNISLEKLQEKKLDPIGFANILMANVATYTATDKTIIEKLDVISLIFLHYKFKFDPDKTSEIENEIIIKPEDENNSVAASRTGSQLNELWSALNTMIVNNNTIKFLNALMKISISELEALNQDAPVFRLLKIRDLLSFAESKNAFAHTLENNLKVYNPEILKKIELFKSIVTSKGLPVSKDFYNNINQLETAIKNKQADINNDYHEGLKPFITNITQAYKDNDFPNLIARLNEFRAFLSQEFPNSSQENILVYLRMNPSFQRFELPPANAFSGLLSAIAKFKEDFSSPQLNSLLFTIQAYETLLEPERFSSLLIQDLSLLPAAAKALDDALPIQAKVKNLSDSTDDYKAHLENIIQSTLTDTGHTLQQQDNIWQIVPLIRSNKSSFELTNFNDEHEQRENLVQKAFQTKFGPVSDNTLQQIRKNNAAFDLALRKYPIVVELQETLTKPNTLNAERMVNFKNLYIKNKSTLAKDPDNFLRRFFKAIANAFGKFTTSPEDTFVRQIEMHGKFAPKRPNFSANQRLPESNKRHKP